MATDDIHEPVLVSSVSDNNDQEGILKIAAETKYDDARSVISKTAPNTIASDHLLPVVTPTGEPKDMIQADDINRSLISPPALKGSTHDSKSGSSKGVIDKAKAIKPPPSSFLPAPLPTSSYKRGCKKLDNVISTTGAVSRVTVPILPRGGE